jgi:Sulfate permease family
LRGFISGVAIVIFVEQLIPELGLQDLASETGAAHGSAWQKAFFVYKNVGETHLLTFYIALTAFFTLVLAKFPSSPYVATNARQGCQTICSKEVEQELGVSYPGYSHRRRCLCLYHDPLSLFRY